MKNRAVRRNGGFTLVELTVVLLVLVALAGILIPKVTGYVERSHGASVSSNIGEINKFVQLHEVKYLGEGFGSRFDSLLNAAETGAFDGIATDAIGVDVNASEPLYVGTLAAHQTAALEEAGIQQVAAMVNLASDKTFGAYEAAGSVDEFVATNALTNALFLTAAQAETLNLPTTDRYVVFGLGAKSSLINKVMSDAPLHFDNADPKNVYSRFLLVFAVPTTAGDFEKARFITAVGAEGASLGAHLSVYYSKEAQ